MSSIAPSALDRSALPAAMLQLAKSHCRIDGSYDDAYVTATLARSIAWFERVTQISVNPVTWSWFPDQGDFVGGVAAVPVSPVNSFTVKDAAAVDISSGYAITTMSTHGIGLYALKGSYVAGMSVAIVSGYQNVGTLDPGISDILLRYTAHLYENREILVLGTDAATPGWINDVIAGYWMPRA
jgi:uncharacterized phiE125 gp8 family phage protein